MVRTDHDTWDLASGVGATATLVAAARALASRQQDPLIDDPFADVPVRAVGIEAFARVLEDDAILADQDSPRLLVYLPPDAQDRLFDNITALSVPGSRIATEYHPDGGTGIADRAAAMSTHWGERGLDLNLGALFYGGERQPVVDYLERLGWQVNARPRPEMFATYGRHFPDDPANAQLRKSLSVTAIRK
ncbi:class I SAM-dependent methyltransferase [Mycolicibacterium sp.]|jgi:O-methyltransferase involved in polyketide biosynthesis|uniref:class I SAM-dependent methyltransferase n=1 Tax=Mycolicibacterium sp. TaxID=2320850 RepID=UPI001A19036F|nr:class I SAM-dependent methyltransferase [Mycolicibacterium sp.]MBJ7400638.1 hypothetical protein [Mycolicibacterium sp.]